jgi:hypothetical protein
MTNQYRQQIASFGTKINELKTSFVHVQPAYLGDRLPGNGVVGCPVMAHCRGRLPADPGLISSSTVGHYVHEDSKRVYRLFSV